MDVDSLLKASGKMFLPEGKIKQFRAQDGDSFFGFFHPSFLVHQEPAAFFGFWAMHGQSTEAFQEFEKWAFDNGALRVIGPIDLSVALNYRLATDAFSEVRFFGEPNNPAEPLRRLEQLSYHLEQNYESWFCEDRASLETWMDRNNLPKLSESLRPHLVFKALTSDYFYSRENEFLELINDSFADNFCFLPLDLAFFRQIYSPEVFKQFCPHSSLAVETPQGKLVGFCANLKNKNQVLLKTAVLQKEYRYLGLGFLALIHESLSRTLPHYSSWAFCLMREGNFPSLLAGPGAQLEKRHYGLFGKKLHVLS